MNSKRDPDSIKGSENTVKLEKILTSKEGLSSNFSLEFLLRSAKKSLNCKHTATHTCHNALLAVNLHSAPNHSTGQSTRPPKAVSQL